METYCEIQPGEVCADCGTHHKKLGSIPARALTESEVNSLNEGEGLTLCESIILMRGMVMSGVPDSTWATEDLVIATDSGAQVASLHEGHGWVVDMELPLDCDCCTPREHAENVLLDTTESLKETMRPNTEYASVDDETIIRWPAEETYGL
jgi:hypothetical protein